MAFPTIVELFAGIQPIKRKYPMVVAHYKYLQKITGNEEAERKEIEAFETWLLKNPEAATSKTLTDSYYHGSKLSSLICFDNVLSMGSPETIDWFWKRIASLESALFPTGRPETAKSDEAVGVSSGAAAAMSVLESNPMFADMIDNVKSTVASLDTSDLGGIVESKEFNKLVKNIQSGLKSGKYRISDLTSTVTAVIGSVQDELDPEMRTVVSSAASMMAAAERGEQPDVGKLLGMVKSLNFK